MARRASLDKPFLVSTIIMMIAGFFIFSSASLGLLARDSQSYSSVAFSQTVLGLFLGSVALFVFAKVDYRFWKKSAFYAFIFALILNAVVIIPGIGFEHGGARRWFLIGSISFQPSELLKLTFIMYFAAWAAGAKDKMATFKMGFLPLLILLGLVGGVLLMQPDTDNFMLIVMAGVAMYLASGGRWRNVLILGLVGIMGITFLAATRPYVRQRINTFFNPQMDSLGSSYQVQQSLIAIGSGGLFGRGFGQSVQKFNFLPEPVGDSIFAVAAEEFGFVGTVLILALFVFFGTRGLKIASRIEDRFGRLVVVGIVIMIVFQAFVNIGAMLGVIPLSGITLPFVSHGGTSLFFTLLEAGIILSISRIQTVK